jgi:8-oxo-dGTP diphosphatase
MLESGMRTNKRVSAIVTRKSDILLIHRRKEGDEYWVVPGGGVEDGETPEQGLTREVKEETSLDINKSSLIATSKEKLTFENKEKEIEHYFYLCELSDGEPVLGGPEAEANSENNWFHLEWVNINHLSNLDLYPNHLKQIVNRIKSKINLGHKPVRSA